MLFPFFFVIITKRECEPAGISIEEEVANCMANIKSSAKRDLKSKELRAKNRAEKTALKSTVKKFEAAVNEGNKEAGHGRKAQQPGLKNILTGYQRGAVSASLGLFEGEGNA